MKGDAAQAKAYHDLQKRYTPRTPVARNAWRAFLVGGLICAVGQGFRYGLLGLGLSPQDVVAPNAAIMVFLSAMLTGLGIYDQIGKFGGMGATLPITGFANAIASPAIEFKREGWILGVGARIFSIAGPVIVYGLLAAMLAGGLRVLLNPPSAS